MGSPSLPIPLQPWADLLSLMPRDLALALSPWLGRLDGALGPVVGRAPDHRQRQPDGFEGISRKGPYDRLLVSEWLLADALPHEFDRRAAMGEHAFLALAHTPPQRAGRLLALVDVGPDQLGTPRLGQLAALILLALRCGDEGGELRWLAAQRLADAPWRGLDPRGVRGWLAARTIARPDLDALKAWAKDEPDLEAGWWIGGPELSDALIGAPGLPQNHILITEPLWEAAPPDLTPSLSVEIRRPGQAPVTLTLPGMRRQDAQRLLRDPFTQPQARPQRPSAPTGSTLRVVESRILRWSADLRPEAWHLPNSPNVPRPGQTKWLPPSIERLVACGWQERSFLALTLEDAGSQLQLWWKGTRQVRWATPPGYQPPASPTVLCRGDKWPGVLVTLDGAGQLYLLRPEGGAAFIAAQDVLAVEESMHTLCMIRLAAPQVVEVMELAISGAARFAPQRVRFEGERPAFHIGNNVRGNSLLIAIQRRPDQWWISVDQARQPHTLSEKSPAAILIDTDADAERVRGVYWDYQREQPALIVEPLAGGPLALLDAEGLRVTLEGMDLGDLPIDQVTVSRADGVIVIQGPPHTPWLKARALHTHRLYLDRLAAREAL